jgi:peptidoglycan/LPS O-acetylase OafA/YrhL
MVMLAGVLRAKAGSRWTSPIRWFGRHSYEVYLSHEFIALGGVALYFRWHIDQLSHASWGMAIWTVAILLLSAPLGAALARFFSEPMNRRLRTSASRRPYPGHAKI